MRLRVSILAAALLCGAAVVSPASGSAVPVHGRGDASFALKPLKYDPALSATKSYFILDAKPGDVIHDQIRVVNTGGKTGTAYLYPVDATTGQTSGAVYLSRQSPRRDVGAWIRLSRSRVTLAPGKNVVVDFTIRVPLHARPGDHLGGIVAENSQIQQSSSKGALQIKIKHLTIDAVELQLPGSAVGVVLPTSVKAGGEHGFQYVYVHLKSAGDVMIKPDASLTVKNSGGRVVAKRQVALDTFLPATAIDYPVLLPKQALSPGSYTAVVRLRSSQSTVPGYRKTQAAPFDVTRTFPFTVTSGEQTKVYSGAAPVTSTATPSSSRSSTSSSLLAIVVGILAVLVVAVLAVLVALLWRGRRAKAALAPTPVTPEPAPTSAAAEAPEPVSTPAEEYEQPGWAGLLAAYEPEPRSLNGRREDETLEELVVSAEEPEPEPEPAELEPVADLEPVAVASAPVVAEPEPLYEYEPVVDYAPVGEYEPLPEYEPLVDYAPLPEYEPAFVPEPEIEFVPEPEIEPELETVPEPEIGPAPVPAAASAVQPIVLDPEELKELIVRHDLTVADAYFRSFPLEEDAAGPPAPTSEPEPEAEPEPGPVLPWQPSPAPLRRDADALNLSSALLDASLVALAAVLATRLLKNDA